MSFLPLLVLFSNTYSSAPPEIDNNCWPQPVCIEGITLVVPLDECVIRFDSRYLSDIHAVNPPYLEIPSKCPDPKNFLNRRSSYQTLRRNEISVLLSDQNYFSLTCKNGSIRYETRAESPANPLHYQRSGVGSMKDFFLSRRLGGGVLYRSIALKYCEELEEMDRKFQKSAQLAYFASGDIEKLRIFFQVPANWKFVQSFTNTESKIFVVLFAQGLFVLSLDASPLDGRVGSMFEFDFLGFLSKRRPPTNPEDTDVWRDIPNRFLQQYIYRKGTAHLLPRTIRRAEMRYFKSEFNKLICFGIDYETRKISIISHSFYRTANRISLPREDEETCADLARELKHIKNSFANTVARCISERTAVEGISEVDKRPQIMSNENDRKEGARLCKVVNHSRNEYCAL